jgi:hypothetical protein
MRLVRPPACGLATFSIKFKAKIFINGVVLFPGYESAASNFCAYQTNVGIYSNTVRGTQKLCGVLANYYTRYCEMICNVQTS